MLQILALETTEAIGSVAAASDAKVLAELQLDSSQRSAQSLAPAVRSLLTTVGWRPRDVQLVALTIGPGSFTGLRLGVALAKTFAYAVGAEILGVDTLLAIAEAAPADVETLAVAIDAQRGDVVAETFRRDPQGFFQVVEPAELLPADVWLGRLAASTAMAGPALKKLAARVPPPVRLLDAACWHPTAGNVARVAARLYAAGQRDDLWKLLPRYFRRSAAEEKSSGQWPVAGGQ